MEGFTAYAGLDAEGIAIFIRFGLGRHGVQAGKGGGAAAVPVKIRAWGAAWVDHGGGGVVGTDSRHANNSAVVVSGGAAVVIDVDAVPALPLVVAASSGAKITPSQLSARAGADDDGVGATATPSSDGTGAALCSWGLNGSSSNLQEHPRTSPTSDRSRGFFVGDGDEAGTSAESSSPACRRSRHRESRSASSWRRREVDDVEPSSQ
jgi:hypothetical protein